MSVTTAGRLQQAIEAMADVAQGRVIAGEVVHAWVRSWGSADELPAPRLSPGAGQHREQRPTTD
jgi:hypothetical protein